MAQAPHFGEGSTYGIYLYPAQVGWNEDEADATRRLNQRLREAGFSEFAVVDAGVIPGGVWAMEVHFRGTREEVYPDLPNDLVNPNG